MRMRHPHRFAIALTLAALSGLGARSAWADKPATTPSPSETSDGDEAPNESPTPRPLPALPGPRSEVERDGDTPVVNAGVVRTNHVDTVVVAEPGSNVTVHGDAGHREYGSDPARKAAIIAAPIFFGVGGAATGLAYLAARADSSCNGNNVRGTTCQTSATPTLVLYDTIVAAVPSAPRWVVGDFAGALIYTGLRSASVVVASVVNWGNDASSWVGPFMLGFLTPVTLGIVDLATTPHREDLQRTHGPPEPQASAPRPAITSVTPVALTDPDRHVRGGMIAVSARF